MVETAVMKCSKLCTFLIFWFCRDCSGHDVRNKPGYGHVLGDLTLECHGDHGDKNHDLYKFCDVIC